MITINHIDVFLWTFRKNEKDVINLYNTMSPVMQLATGGSMLATKRLVEQTGAKVVGGTAVINLKYLNSVELENMHLVCGEDVLR